MTRITHRSHEERTMLRLLAISLITLLVLGCELIAETAYVPEDAEEATNNWLVDFSHTNPDYVDQAKSAFAYAADGDLCKAGRRFDDLVEEAQAHDGSRMPVAAYNAGVLFTRQVWNGSHCGAFHPGTRSPVDLLEYALKHMPHREMDAEIHMQLGGAYFLELDVPRRAGWSNPPLGTTTLKKRSIEHYCTASNLRPFYKEQVNELFDELNWSPCES